MIKNKREFSKVEMTRLLLICQTMERAQISIPKVPLVTTDKWMMIWYGNHSLRQIYDAFKEKGAI